MIKLFTTLKDKALGAKDGHPLANPKEAEEIFEELRGGDALKSLEEVTHWIESLRHDESLKPERRFELVKRLDEIGQPHRIKVGRDYASVSRQSRFQEAKLWTAKHDYWTHTLDAYMDLIARIERKDKGTDALARQAGLIALRALRAASRRLKWLYVRYGPVPADIWASIAKAYRFAESRKVHNLRAPVYPGIPGDSSPEDEFMRSVLLSASAPDALTPVEMDVCERLIAHFAGRFKVAAQASPESVYWMDLDQARQPLRLAAPPAQLTPGLRFFATAEGHADLAGMLARFEQANELPGGVDFGGTPDPRVVREVFKHLALNWAPQPPVRKSERKRMQTRMSIAHGFDQALELTRQGAMDLALDFAPVEAETWVVENVSSGGFGATVAQVKGDWLKIGALIAVQPDLPGSAGGRWDLAIIRRLSRDAGTDAKTQASTGVQIISRKATTVALRNSGGKWSGDRETLDGIYVPDSGQPGVATLVMPQGAYLPGEQLHALIDGRKHLFFPIAVTERGDDYDLVTFRDLVEET